MGSFKLYHKKTEKKITYGCDSFNYIIYIIINVYVYNVSVIINNK